MQAAEDATACQECGEIAEHESGHRQSDSRLLENPSIVPRQQAVQQCGACQPGEQRTIFHWIPGPISSPTKFLISPIATQNDTNPQDRPGKQRPTTCRAEPLIVRLGGHQRGTGQRKGDRPGSVAQEDNRRMYQHGRMLQQRTEANALVMLGQTRTHGVGGKHHDSYQKEPVGHDDAKSAHRKNRRGPPCRYPIGMGQDDE